MADQDDNELKEIKNSEHLGMVDKLQAKIHPIVDRNDAGTVTYPRREYLQSRANQRKAAYDEEQRRKAQMGKK